MRRTGKKDFRANISQGGSGEAVELSEADQALCIKASQVLGLEFSGVDLIYVHKRVTDIATNIAESAGAKADVSISTLYPVTFNDVSLTEDMIGTLQNVAGKDRVKLIPAVTGAEDFSYYQQKIPGFFFFLGGMPKGWDPLTAPAHHTPDFFIDDSGMVLGVRSLSRLAVDYMEKKAKK